MPFDYVEYQKKCDSLTTEQLHREWENYTRQIAGGATSTATSVLFSPLTAGISLVGLGLSAPRIHNARKKREIIEAGLQARGTTHNTRKRDVIAPMAVAGTLGGLTLGLAGPGADMIAGEAVGHGLEYAVSHAALDGTGAILEHTHDEHSKKKADARLKIQYQTFQQQFVQEQQKLQTGHPQPGLQAPSPVSQLSRPGTPQQSEVLQNQAQISGQEQKYEVVPIPAAHSNSISYQPSSHQEKFTPPTASLQAQADGPLPYYKPEKYLVTVPAPSMDGHTSLFPAQLPDCPTPESVPSAPPTQNRAEESLPNVSDMKIDLPPPPTMEEEILFLKARLLQLEIEKREAAVAQQIPQTSAGLIEKPSIPAQITVETEIRTGGDVDRKESHPSLTVSSPSALQPQEQQYYPPPPASPALPPRSPALPPRSPSIQSQQFFPPPPPPPPPLHPPASPHPHVQQYVPPPPPPPTQTPYTYQPQNYPPPPPSPHTLQPYIQRNDSGYYSNVTTPSPLNRLSQSYTPVQTGYTVPLQSAENPQHSHHPSVSSISNGQLSPMSPAPPPYFPPPPSTAPTGLGKDYFAQGIPPPSPSSGGHQNYQPNGYQGQTFHGTQGWQWGTAAPVQIQGEPNYGPPPPVPGPYRG